MDDEDYINSSQIDLSDESITFWAIKLKCSEKDLRDSILKIGNNINVVTMYLEMNQLIKK